MSIKYSGKTPPRLSAQTIMFFTQPSVLVCVVLVVFMYWRLPTRIDMRIEVNAPLPAFDRAALPNSLNDGTFPFAQISRLTVAFPDSPKQRQLVMSNIREMRLIPDDALHVDIQEISGISEVRLQGIVSACQARSGEVWRDMRRTQFDRLLESRTGIWWILGGWLVLNGLGWIKIYQALK